jgi:predicted RNA-binding Zn ribbon-like protein
MTSENLDLAAPQPGERQPAPGPLATVQAFVNTFYDLTADDGGDVLTNPAALRDWLADRDLLDRRTRLGRRDLERGLAIREGLRALAYANNSRPLDTDTIDAMRRASEGARTEVRIEPDGPRFFPPAGSTIDGAFGALLSIVAAAMIDGRWPHLKACLGRDCGWVFYDRSRNQSARWCSTNICGNREKARAYYRRKTLDDEQ